MPSQFIDKENNYDKMGLKKFEFLPNFTFYYLAEYSAGWPKLSAGFAEIFGRIFGFGRTLLIRDTNNKGMILIFKNQNLIVQSKKVKKILILLTFEK